MLLATARARLGGRALPTCRYRCVLLPARLQSSGNDWSLDAMLTVSFGWPSKSGLGASSATPSPSTPSSAQAFRALVGPRSGPPCLREPPTSVGAGRFAFSDHSRARFQPFEAISSNKVWPTVAPPLFGRGHAKSRSPRRATRKERTLDCGTPWSRAFKRHHADLNPKIPNSSSRLSRYAANLRPSKPRTFSTTATRGRVSERIRMNAGNRFLSSSPPSCCPATENGGQGRPAATTSTPRQ